MNDQIKVLIVENGNSRFVNWTRDMSSSREEVTFEDLQSELGDFEGYLLDTEFDVYCSEYPDGMTQNVEIDSLLRHLGYSSLSGLRGKAVVHIQKNSAAMKATEEWLSRKATN
jgi:hypothetical protein